VHFKLNFARGQVYPRELLQKLRVQGLGLAREYDFGLVQGRHCAVDISLGIRPEVDRELAILLVIRRVEPIVVEVGHRELEFVKTELKLVTFESDLENAVRRILKLASVVGQRVRRLGVRNAVRASLRPRFGACLLVCEPLLERSFSGGRGSRWTDLPSLPEIKARPQYCQLRLSSTINSDLKLPS